jgi:hypothetical protein
MASPPPRRTRSQAQTGNTHLIGWLGSDSQSANVLATANMHLKIRSAVVQKLPVNMRNGFEVVKIETQVLTLLVSSAAFAAKFRQFAPTVISGLQTTGWNISEIKLKVQGGLGLPEVQKPLREARILDQGDLKAFETLKLNLRPGPLADAVSKLLRHHQGSIKPTSTPDETQPELPPVKHK